MSARPERMSDDARDAMMAKLDGWALAQDGKAMVKHYRFTNFNAAMGFMMRAGLTAEQLDHHPEWFNVYNRVDVTLTTHDCNGLSVLDEKLVPLISATAQRFEAKIVKAS